MNRISDAFKVNWKFDTPAFENGVQEMVKASHRTELSKSFRKGVSGEWRNEFKPEHVEAFKETDANGWLVKLGYEENEDWGL